MAKFKVGDSPSTSFTIGNSRCNGGTWYSAGDVGIDEENLARDYPFLVWDSEPKKFVAQTPKATPQSESVKPVKKKK